MSDTWGCEFLDLWEPEPFSYHGKYPHAVWLPVSFIQRITDTLYQGQISAANDEKLRTLAEDINRNGLQEPGLIIYNEVSIKLQDGNHRFLACARYLGWEKFWVESQYKRGTINNGHSVGTVVHEFIEGLSEAKWT